jgi:chromosome segregation ATPase
MKSEDRALRKLERTCRVLRDAAMAARPATKGLADACRAAAARRRVEDLEAENARLRREAHEARARARKAEAERDEARRRLDALSRAAAPTLWPAHAFLF